MVRRRELGECRPISGGTAPQMLDTDDLALWYALNRLII
jgi:hypothetical protein